MTPKEAYGHAKKHGSSNKTREIACQDSAYAYYYALEVDKCPREDTRETACKDPPFAYYYAKNIDKKSREDTRKAACKDPLQAYYYIKYVDKDFHEDTWEAVKGTEFEEKYNKSLNQIEKEKIV